MGEEDIIYDKTVSIEDLLLIFTKLKTHKIKVIGNQSIDA